jgi:hypothetical protein
MQIQKNQDIRKNFQNFFYKLSKYTHEFRILAIESNNPQKQK